MGLKASHGKDYICKEDGKILQIKELIKIWKPKWQLSLLLTTAGGFRNRKKTA